jgi:hypothetical protein
VTNPLQVDADLEATAESQESEISRVTEIELQTALRQGSGQAGFSMLSIPKAYVAGVDVEIRRQEPSKHASAHHIPLPQPVGGESRRPQPFLRIEYR